MSIEFNGKVIETSPMGYLENAEDWNEDLCKYMAEQEKIELTERHWDVINHLRDEFFNNAGNQPNTRKLVKFSKKNGERKLMQKFYTIYSQGTQVNRVEESQAFPKVEERVVIDYIHSYIFNSLDCK